MAGRNLFEPGGSRSEEPDALPFLQQPRTAAAIVPANKRVSVC